MAELLTRQDIGNRLSRISTIVGAELNRFKRAQDGPLVEPPNSPYLWAYSKYGASPSCGGRADDFDSSSHSVRLSPVVLLRRELSREKLLTDAITTLTGITAKLEQLTSDLHEDGPQLTQDLHRLIGLEDLALATCGAVYLAMADITRTATNKSTSSSQPKSC